MLEVVTFVAVIVVSMVSWNNNLKSHGFVALFFVDCNKSFINIETSCDPYQVYTETYYLLPLLAKTFVTMFAW